MRTVLLPALALGAMTSVAVADPVRLTDPDSIELTRARIAAVSRILLEFSAEVGPARLTDTQRNALARVLFAFDPESGPVRLTESQMERLTAGLAFVSIDALAAAMGPMRRTGTRVRTHASRRHLVEAAFGTGEAYAIGDAAAVDLSNSFFADGDFTIGGGFSLEVHRPGFSAGRVTSFVISFDLPG